MITNSSEDYGSDSLGNEDSPRRLNTETTIMTMGGSTDNITMNAGHVRRLTKRAKLSPLLVKTSEMVDGN